MTALEHFYGSLGMSQVGGGAQFYRHVDYITGSKIISISDRPLFKEYVAELLLGTKPGMGQEEVTLVPETLTRNMPSFLNRLLGISVERQEALFSYLMEVLNKVKLNPRAISSESMGVSSLARLSSPSDGKSAPDSSLRVQKASSSSTISGAGGLSATLHVLRLPSNGGDKVGLLTGSVLSVWPRLQQLLREKGREKGDERDKAVCMIRVVYCVLAGEAGAHCERLAGVLIPPGISESDFNTEQGARKYQVEARPSLIEKKPVEETAGPVHSEFDQWAKNDPGEAKPVQTSGFKLPKKRKRSIVQAKETGITQVSQAKETGITKAKETGITKAPTEPPAHPDVALFEESLEVRVLKGFKKRLRVAQPTLSTLFSSRSVKPHSNPNPNLNLT